MHQQEFAFKKARASPPLGCFGSRCKHGAHGAALRPSHGLRAAGQPRSPDPELHSTAGDGLQPLSPALLRQGEPNNPGLPGRICPALIPNAKGTDKMYRYTNPTHREPLTLGFHCMHWQLPTSPTNCPQYKLEYFPMRQSLMGGKLFHPVQGHLCLLGSTSAPGQNHFSSLTPLVSGVIRRENPRSSSALPQGQGSLALHCTKGRGEGERSNSTECQELRVTQGECSFFPFLNLASFRGH